MFERHLVEFDAEIFTDHLATGEDRDVFQHGLSAVAEARSLHGGDFQSTAQLVDDERCERFAFDIFGDDDERLRGLDHRFKKRKQFLQARQLFLVDQDIGVIHFHAHLVGVGDEVGGDVAAVELHALDDFEFGLQRFRFFDSDHALVADFLHRVGEEAANFGIAVGGNRADLGDLFVRCDLLRVLLQVRDHRFNREVDAALEVHWVHAGGDGLGAFLHDRLSENGRGRGAVTGKVG